MAQITISQETLLTTLDLETYLVGSGMPPGAHFTVDEVQDPVVIKWDDPADPSMSRKMKIASGLLPDPDAPPPPVTIDYASMTKEKIEQHVLDHHLVNLNTRMSKAKLIEAAIQLDAAAV